MGTGGLLSGLLATYSLSSLGEWAAEPCPFVESEGHRRVTDRKEQLLTILDAEWREFLEAGGVEFDGDKDTGLCPFHDDTGTSFSTYVSETTGHRGWKCFTGCGSGNLIDFYMQRHDLSFRDALQTLCDDRGIEKAPKAGRTGEASTGKARGTPTAEYVYKDENGQPRFRVTRYDRGDDKDFFQARFDAELGEFVSGKGCMSGVERVPYRLPEWKDSPIVVLVEGEKCADALWAMGVPATTTAGGSSSWRRFYSAHFAGKRTLLLPDNDDPGRKYVQAAARDLHGVAATVKVLELPGLADGEDVVDWLAKGGSKAQLAELAKNTVAWEPVASSQTPLGPAPTPVELRTDMGNSRRVVHHFGENLKHTQAHGWLVWDGNRWERDEKEIAAALVKTSARRIFDEAKQADDEQANKLRKWGVLSQSSARVRGALFMLSSEPEISARFKDFDQDPWLLTVANGTVDLRTGELRPHDRGDFITKRAPVPYVPDADCPTWKRFLHRIMDGDEEMIGLLQRAAGYSLTGDIREQCWFFAYGTGSNGKSTFLNVILDIVGDHGLKAVESLLVRTKNEGHPTEVADLSGVRLAVCTEVDQGRSLNVVRIKEMTGGDRMTGRKMRQDFFQFEPTHKIWLAANHRPSVSDTTDSTWRRLVLLPFTVSIPKSEQDKSLPTKLKEEWPGILRWMVEGCQWWRREGLLVPETVLAATKEYRATEDYIGGFLEERCVTGDPYSAAARDLYQAYGEWCEEQGLRTCSQKAFGTRLTERGFAREKSSLTRRWQWIGLGLVPIDPSTWVPDGEEGERGGMWK
jgi:putative DNA primase/helicase